MNDNRKQMRTMIKRYDILKALGTVLLLTSVCLGAGAQQTGKQQEAALKVEGTVTDRFGNPLHGALVISSNGTNAIVTDFHGAFEVMVTDRSGGIEVSHPGFETQQVDIGTENGSLRIALGEDSFDRDLPIDLGFSTFRKEEISGSVSTVGGSELARSPVQTTREALTGRLPGLYTYEASSEPGGADTQMWLRGATTARKNQPVLILDGIVFDYAQNVILDMITPTEIEAVTVLKDAASQAIYGIQGGDGVIVVTTKRGRPGKLEVKVTADMRAQQVITVPTLYSSAAYAEMRNQAFRNDNRGPLPFKDADIEQFRLGADREHYPENIWYDMFFRKISLVQRAGVDIYGGSENITYYSNVNFMHQGSHFETDKNNSYNSNFQLYRVNFRSNVDLKINKFLSADLKLAGNIKRDNTPTTSQSAVYGLLFDLPPTTYGPVTPRVTRPDPSNPGSEIVDPGGQVVVLNSVNESAYSKLNSVGYGKSTYANVYSQVGIKLDMGFLARGLELSGSVGYRTESNNMLNNTRSYERWVREGSFDELEFRNKDNNVDGTLRQSKTTHLMHLLNYRGMLNYNNSFGRHHVGAVAYMYFQQLTKSETSNSDRTLNLPYARANTGFEVSYNFDNRYLLRLDAGYSGSEQYARKHRFVWTPAFSAAWVLSNEKFMKNAGWLSMLKFRGSYGVTATDRSGLARFSYMDNVKNENSPGWLEWSVKELSFGNIDLHAERIRKTNLGLDLGLFNQLNVSVDLFREHTTDMAIPSDASIPDYYGYPLSDDPNKTMFPMINGGEFRNEGWEVTVDYRKTIDRDWSFGAGGWVSYTRNKYIFSGELSAGDGYVYPYRKDGFPIGQEFGYQVDYNYGAGNGMFNTAVERDAIVYGDMAKQRVGDLVYRDRNDDGIVDKKDQVPLGDGAIPSTVYAFYGDLRWRGLEFSVMFQGVGRWERIMSGKGIYEGDSTNDGIYSALHANAWTWDRYTNDEPITYPALSTSASSSQQPSDFFVYNRAYLRLKNLEIAYNLPQKWLRKAKIDNVRVALSGQNLWTWDKLKTKDFGPEGGGYAAFPVMRVYNLGVTLQF